MKLPICYILEQLGDYLEDNSIEDEEAGYLVERPRFYEREQVLKREQLYLSAEYIFHCSRRENGSFLIGKTKGFHTFCIKEGKSIYGLSNRIHRLFDEAEEWFIQMKQCVEADGSLADILSIAGKYIPYYMAVMDPNFFIVERFRKDKASDMDIHAETGYLKMDIVNMLRQDEFYDTVENYVKPFLYVCRGLPDRFLCVNIMEKSLYRGRINVREEEAKPFPVWLPFFLECVRDVISPVFLKESRMQSHTEKQHAFMRILLEGKENYQDELFLFLHDVNWAQKGKYLCICLQMQSTEEQEGISYYARELEYLIKESISVIFENRIFLVHYISDHEAMEQESRKKLKYFIRESNFRMGASRVYSDITKTRYARSQAQIALDYGMQYESQQWKYEFDDVVFSYLAQNCLRELPVDFVGSPAFMILKNYDEKSNSGLYETFIEYIKSDFNMVQAAKRLFIHRGTLIYRLNKIQELTGARWGNWKEKMYLAWSVMLREDGI
ncbi:MAG: hypothetical protein HFG80_11665 [Eubacterium sp.]|nr:hypothetical protein [Eubacterium sp.]